MEIALQAGICGDNSNERRKDSDSVHTIHPIAGYDKEIDEINALIPVLKCGDLNIVKEEIKKRLD